VSHAVARAGRQGVPHPDQGIPIAGRERIFTKAERGHPPGQARPVSGDIGHHTLEDAAKRVGLAKQGRLDGRCQRQSVDQLAERPVEYRIEQREQPEHEQVFPVQRKSGVVGNALAETCPECRLDDELGWLLHTKRRQEQEAGPPPEVIHTQQAHGL